METKSKHTPGPWKVFNSKYADKPGIETDDETFSVVVFGKISESCGVDGRTEDEKQANAKLIAAAPDLLEALQAIVNWLESPADALSDKDFNAAKEAIKKATE